MSPVGDELNLALTSDFPSTTNSDVLARIQAASESTSRLDTAHYLDGSRALPIGASALSITWCAGPRVLRYR
jgi:hypothetical protein